MDATTAPVPWHLADGDEPKRPPRPALVRAVGTALSEGLSTAEVLSLAIATAAVVAAMWISGTLEPERLLTDPGQRAVWFLVGLAVVRPLTWVPYGAVLVATRAGFDRILPGARPVRRGLAANVATVGWLAAAWFVVQAVVPVARGAVSDALAFALGGGSIEHFSSASADWTVWRGLLLAGAVVFVRIGVPPLGPDLGFARQPVLGFARGRRGTVDRAVAAVAVAGSAVVLVVAWFTR